jgi:hypothetical protein
VNWESWRSYLHGSWVRQLRDGGPPPIGWRARLAPLVPRVATRYGGHGGGLAAGSTMSDASWATLAVRG